MDAFDFRNRLIQDYARFSRSFTRIKAEDIQKVVDAIYDRQQFWPAPLVQINPSFLPSGAVEALAHQGVLHRECAQIFRKQKREGSQGISIRLHKHQQEAIACAQKRQTYVLTTGTGSGKSLAYFIPIVDAVLKAKATDPTPRTRAIIIYPMNALANSQREELIGYLGEDDASQPITFGRYTGQEDEAERNRLAASPPDILLTNFMMLELLMTRQDDKDRAVMRNAHGLEFLVLDELHTYRGRQGADVAMLVRRVREALNPDLLCIGTSATMATEGTEQDRARVVASVASRLFGTQVAPENVITETLRRVTPEVSKAILNINPEQIAEGAALATGIARICPSCGYGHFRDQLESERCYACGAALDDDVRVSRLYRIENVSTRRVERITADQEDRIRQGYDTQTTFQYATENGRLRRERLEVSEGGEVLFDLQYGPAATVWRMNLGWRRRKEQSVFGFFIDPMTGRWVGDPAANGASEGGKKAKEDTAQAERIVPFVEDRKNLLILRPRVPLEEATMVTLQYALKRGIESVFQLEESELVAEPLPRRDERRAILLYEGAEGGAGVLSRLAAEPDALRRIAERALEICHFQCPESGWDPDALEGAQELDSEGKPICEAGCYRCLLSYYNQPDHDLIDRLDKEHDGLAPKLLVRLTRSTLRRVEDQSAALTRLSGSTLERAWLDAVEAEGLRKPDRAQVDLTEFAVRPDFLYDAQQALVFIDGPHHKQERQQALDEAKTRQLEEAGYVVIRFPADAETWPALFQEFQDVFGRPARRTEA